MNWINNSLDVFTDSTSLAPLFQIKKTQFSYDFILVSIKTLSGAQPDLICKLLQKDFRLTRKTPTRFSNSKAWRGLFNNSTYYDFTNGAYGVALTNRARALSNCNAIMIVYNPKPWHLKKLHQILFASQSVFSYTISGVEFTFDFVLNKRKYVRQLKDLLRRTGYLQYGRVGFSYGVPPNPTDYINSRKSVKQLRVYTHPEDYKADRRNYHRVLRFEIHINRMKTKRLGLHSFTDLLSYDLGLLDELRFYTPRPLETWRSLMAFNTSGFFCDLLAKIFSKKGFQQTLVWVRTEIKGCQNNCWGHEWDCPLSDLAHDVTGKKRFDIIQDCEHAKPFKNFRREFTDEIVRMRLLKRKMRRAFKAWKKS